MRKLVYLLTFMVANIGFSQVYETGVSYNLGSFVGEIEQKSTLTNNIGVVIKKNMNPRISYRLAINHLESKNSQLSEVSGGIDFNFSEYNLIRTQREKKRTAYLIFEAATLFYKTNQTNTKFAFALPIGIGYKQAISNHFVYSLEAKGRVALTDALDNIKTNKSTLDAYYYFGASIYYTFGWPKGSKNQIRF